MKVYLAAPLFNPLERDFNAAVERELAPIVDVFLPQRDGALLTKLVSEGSRVELARQVVFSRDTQALAEVDFVVAILDGRTVDEGVAFELGYANALGKPCLGFKSDDRAMLPTGDNPMIVCGCQSISASIEELVRQVQAMANELLRARASSANEANLHRSMPCSF